MRVRLEEALTPEQKVAVDSWYAPHHSFSDHAFPSPSHLRTFISATFGDKGEHEEEISQHLAKHGMKIHDYVSGTAIDKHGRTVKIGKALGKTEGGHLLDKFTNDPARKSVGAHADYHICISRHPHDVAGMTSGGHSWENQSCMNFETGSNRRYLPHDVEHGTHVAYYVHKDDKELEKPLARIALKPFISQDGRGTTVLRPETAVYGNASSAFDKSVSKWAHTHFPIPDGLIVEKHPELYHDSGSTTAMSQATAESIAKQPDWYVSDYKNTLGLDHYGYIRKQIIKDHPLSKDTVIHVAKHGDGDDMDRLIRNKHAEHSDESLALAVSNHNLAFDAAKHPYAGDKTFREIYKYMDEIKSEHSAVKENMLKNPNFSAEHIDRYLEWEKKSGGHPALISHNILRNPNVQDRHVKHIVDMLADREKKITGRDTINTSTISMHLASSPVESAKVQKMVLPYIEDKHLTNVSNNWSLKGGMIDHLLDRAEKSTHFQPRENYPKSAAESDKSFIASNLARTADPTHIDRIMKFAADPETGMFHQDFASRLPSKAIEKFSHDQVTRLIKDSPVGGVSNLAANIHGDTLSKEHHDMLMNHPTAEVRGSYLANTTMKVTPEHMIKMFDDTKPEHQPYMAMMIGRRSYADQAWGNLHSIEGHKVLDNKLISHPSRLVKDLFFKENPRALAPHMVPAFVGDDKDSHLALTRVYNRHPSYHEDPAVAEFAVYHPNKDVVKEHASHLHRNTPLSKRHAEALLAHDDPEIDTHVASTGMHPDTAKTLAMRAIDRAEHPVVAKGDDWVANDNRNTSLMSQALQHVDVGHLPHIADHLVSKLAPLSNDPDVLHAKSMGIGSNLSDSKIGQYHRLQHRLSQLTSHVGLSAESLTKLYDHADGEATERVIIHSNAPYELWHKYASQLGDIEDMRYMYKRHPKHMEFMRRFREEKLNESVSLGKTKVWILE